MYSLVAEVSTNITIKRACKIGSFWCESKLIQISFQVTYSIPSKQNHITKVNHLKETRNSFKKWPLNLWFISNKSIVEVENITKAATFNSFLHLSYKNTITFLWQLFLIFFHERNINWWFLGVTQKYESHVSFKNFFGK